MLTAKQDEVFGEVKRLLSEHFDNYVVIIESEIEHPDTHEMATFWRGSYQGHSCAVGLLEKYKTDLTREVKEE